MLREYIFRIPSIEYIVFIREINTYLGFIIADNFRKMYPQLGIETILHDQDIFHHMREYLGRYRELGRIDRYEFVSLVRRTLGINFDRIDINNFTQLGARNISLKDPTAHDAYRTMIENGISGIPIVDDQGKFLGIATKERVMQEVIMQLLHKEPQK